MTYDKYRNWPLPTDTATMAPSPMRAGHLRSTLEQQVLADLAVTEDQIDRMEILDSYGAWHARSYRAMIVRAITEILGDGLRAVSAPLIDGQLPGVVPIHRGRVGQEKINSNILEI